MYGINKKGRRRGRRRGRRSFRRYRRNPPGVVGKLTGQAPKVLWGTVGAIGTEMVPAFAGRFIPIPAGRVGQYAVKIGSAIGVSWAVRRFVGKAQGEAALFGGLLAVALGPVRDFILPALGFVTVPGVSSYLPDGMGSYLPGGGD